MSMTCKQCGESFPRSQPFDVFELRRHKMLPADSESMTHTAVIEDGGMFCSRECVSNYLKAGQQSGVFDLSALRRKMGVEPK